MAEVRFTNFARTTVADTTLSAAATAVTLTSVTGMPTLAASNWTYFVLTRLSDNGTEIVKCTALDTSTKIATIVRAQGGTTAKAFSLGDRIENFVVADALNDLRSQWQTEIQDSLNNTITRGSVVVGGESNVPTELVGKTANKVLGGDGTDIIALGLKGDATWAHNAGDLALTLADNSVTGTKLADNGTALAKLVHATAQGKLIGRKTAVGGAWEEVATDGVTLEFPAAGSLQLKDGGVSTAKLADAGVTSDKMTESLLRYAAVTIGAADVRTLYTTAYPLVAAPGAGKIIVPHRVTIFVDYNTAAYNGVSVRLRYTGAAGIIPSDTAGNLSRTEDRLIVLAAYALDLNASGAGIINQPLVLHATGDCGGSGNSNLYARIWYSVITPGY